MCEERSCQDLLADHGEVTLDHLSGAWRVYQLRRGHRFATDDVLVAWTAARARPEALSLLDLGAGVGSVGLMTLQRMRPEARLTCLEVQQVSVELLRRTVAYNGLERRVDPICGDLRQQGLPGKFELITANPPYLPEGRAVRSPHPQRAAARLELHGDITDYCRAAARHLEPLGRFCFCHAAADPRPEPAVAAAGLELLSRQEVIFRAGRPPHLALFCCGFPQRHEGALPDLPPLMIRDDQRQRTEAYRQVRRELLIEV
jgi:tRNA1Val (adenine37-N6)-methyltransferase